MCAQQRPPTFDALVQCRRIAPEAFSPSARGRQYRLFHGSHEGTEFDLEVTRIDTIPGTYLVILIRGSPAYQQQRRVEYITYDATLEAALDTGLEIARKLIDGRLG